MSATVGAKTTARTRTSFRRHGAAEGPVLERDCCLWVSHCILKVDVIPTMDSVRTIDVVEVMDLDDG